MIKRRVLHFIRKSTQLRASFINNQISHHLDFEPFIVFRENKSKLNDGGFADFNLKEYNCLDLSENETIKEKIRFKTIKTLSKKQLLLIEDFIKKNEIDVCHFHYGTDCGIFYPLLKKLMVPSLVSFYGYDCSSFPSYLLGFGRKYLQTRVFKRISAVLAMSPDMKTDLIKAGCPEGKIIVHYHGIDSKRFFHNPEYSEKQKITLLILANLVPQKGHLFLLESIKQLLEKGTTNFELRIIGVGELELKLKKYVEKNNLSDFVSFKGKIKYASDDMINEYQNADIFVLPSVIAPNGDKEGIPGTVVEAMSAGIPVISTCHAGIPYIIESGKTGLLVAEYDYDALTLAIQQLMQNRDLREKIGKAGQEYALQHLDIEDKERELEEIYKRFMIVDS